MNNEPSGDYYDYTKTMQPERPWLLAIDGEDDEPLGAIEVRGGSISLTLKENQVVKITK